MGGGLNKKNSLDTGEGGCKVVQEIQTLVNLDLLIQQSNFGFVQYSNLIGFG